MSILRERAHDWPPPEVARNSEFRVDSSSTCVPVPFRSEVAVSGPEGQGCAHRSGFPHQGGSFAQDVIDGTDHRR
jgi:hypothetical protein